MSYEPRDLLPRVRDGLRIGHGQVLDAMIHDGLWCPFEQCHMGVSGEIVAEQYGVSREAQDVYAVESHRRALDATASGRFRDEILPVTLPGRSGAPVVVDRDEPIRADTTPDALRKLAPAFVWRDRHGRQRAWRQRQCRGARGGVGRPRPRPRRPPLARIVAQATSGLPTAGADDPSDRCARVSGRLAAGRGRPVRKSTRRSRPRWWRARQPRPRSARVNVNGGAVAPAIHYASGARI
jgi:acetyl-CoA C-acetyltransferase